MTENTENTGNAENTDDPTTDTSAADPLPSPDDLQDADGDNPSDDGSAPDVDSMTTFLPHGLRIN